MKRTLNPIIIALLVCLTSALYSQSNPAVLLHSGATSFPENVREYLNEATINNDEMIENHYYRLLQFHQIPDNEELKAIAQAGIELLEYIPHNTYVASLPTDFELEKLEFLGVRSIQSIDTEMKTGTRNLPGKSPRMVV